ncbi:MAG: threonine--tRNA ligase [Coriobacteriales bacterium]|jgi:threonyl-tRNA synthetase|nr:threonine--tRNA ligase [Coriobacteriales bacterium]
MSGQLEHTPENLQMLRHSAAHIMAQAIQELHPEAHFGIGPAVENGFYYDIELPETLGPDDLKAIEKRMKKIVGRHEDFTRKVVDKGEARAIFADQPLKLELIDELPADEEITVYIQGDAEAALAAKDAEARNAAKVYLDLCRGPHIANTSELAAFKLTKLAGAYWRGDADRQMLQRVYGTAFFSQEELDAYLKQIEEAEKRDHRKLGRELGIYMTSEEAGVGLPLYKPNGARIIRVLQEWLRQGLYRRGYQEVITPHIYNADVWKRSGHYDFYHENMYFFNIDESEEKDGSKLSEYGVKPMNCPGHVLLYADELRSYKELPIRYFEFGTVYRHEMSGVVHGLLRARGFTQDDAHLFCRTDQVEDEVVKILELVDAIMSTFGFPYMAEISTRPEHSIGSDEKWEQAQSALENACKRYGLAYDINEGDGAFYGPKIDIKVKDAIGRTWQCSTVQVDFNFPERFKLTYRTADNGEEQPWMLHRAIFGSIERFLGILLEHYAGALPAWLSPTQAVVVPIADRHLDYAEQVAAKLRVLPEASAQGGARVEVYAQNEPMRAKIRRAQKQKVPYMLVVGDDEVAATSVSVRDRHAGDQGAMSLADFAAKFAGEISFPAL